MIAVMILEDHDQIVGTDFVRQVSLLEPYTEAPAALTWARAELFCPAHIGKTVGEFRTAMSRFGNYEFVHGKIPLAHQTVQTSDTLR